MSSPMACSPSRAWLLGRVLGHCPGCACALSAPGRASCTRSLGSPSSNPPILWEGGGGRASGLRPQHVLTPCLAPQGKGLPGPPVSTDHPPPRPVAPSHSEPGWLPRPKRAPSPPPSSCPSPVGGPQSFVDVGCRPVSHVLPALPPQGEAGVSGVPGGAGLRGPPVSDWPPPSPLLRERPCPLGHPQFNPQGLPPPSAPFLPPLPLTPSTLLLPHFLSRGLDGNPG